jgi:hypothetical protein
LPTKEKGSESFLNRWRWGVWFRQLLENVDLAGYRRPLFGIASKMAHASHESRFHLIGEVGKNA